MQLILHGVVDFPPNIAFVGGAISQKEQPYWSNFDSRLFESNGSYADGVYYAPENNPFGGWTRGYRIFANRGAGVIPFPVQVPEVEIGDSSVWPPVLGYMGEGYDNLNNMMWFFDGPVINRDDSTGLSTYYYSVYPDDQDGAYADLVRGAEFILFSSVIGLDGYNNATVSAASTLEIVDGSKISTFDFSTAPILSAESNAMSTALIDGRRDRVNTTYQIGYFHNGTQTPDIFWTNRVLCEETQS